MARDFFCCVFPVMSTKRFRVAFSFAGEKRDFVAQIAALLANRFGEDKILYDKYYEAKFAKAGLAFSLPELYHNESDLIVTVFCPDYEKKEWCGLEWSAIYGLIKRGKVDQVMLTRFDRVEGKGLYGLAGFVELDHKTPEEAAKLILERLADNEGNPKDHYTRPAPSSAPVLKTSIPHNLPTLQPFFGRDDELKKIADALDPDSRTWGALIDGPGGMGKTSLAVRAAYDAPPADFKRIVFVSLKTRELDDDGVRDLSGFILSGLAELFGELARELGRDDILKAVEEQRPRLLLDALRGTQTLLILDNLESLVKKDRDTVFTFVKKLPAGCKAILTSRGRIGSGAEELILEKIGEDAALATLAELATHNPALAKTSVAERLVLYRETGGKPLLLRWTAGQIGRGHCLTFTDALAYLRSCPEGNDPLEFIFGDLVDDFREAETDVVCALTFFSLPAKVEHVMRILNPISESSEREAARVALYGALNRPLPADVAFRETDNKYNESEVDAALRCLVNRSLAVPTEELQTFSLVPMVADFLRKKKPEVVAKTAGRLEKCAFTFIIENGCANHSRFPVLEAAWPWLAPSLSLFLSGDNARLQTICAALEFFLESQGRWDERLSLCERAEGVALAAGDYYNAGWRAQKSGHIYGLRRQADLLLTCAERAFAYWQRAQAGPRESASAAQMFGLCHSLRKDHSAAIAAYNEALELHRTIDGNGVDVSICLNALANAEAEAGHLAAAEQHYHESLRLAHTVGNREGAAITTGNLARLALDREDWSAAETLSRQALSFVTPLHNKQWIASDSRILAHALICQGKAAEALPHAQLALEIFANMRSPDLAAAQAILAECEAALAAE